MTDNESSSTNKKMNASSTGPKQNMLLVASDGSQETDCLVLVGNEGFEENSHLLRYWSGYFHGAFRSGMKESTTMRFEFPHRDPEEWRWIKSLTTPFGDGRITTANVMTALSWFDELSSTQGMELCDKSLSSEIIRLELLSDESLQKSTNYYLTMGETERSNVVSQGEMVFKWLETAQRHNLCRTKISCYNKVCSIIENKPFIFCSQRHSPDLIERLINHLKVDDLESTKNIRNKLVDFCGGNTFESKESMQNELLPKLVRSKFRLDFVNTALQAQLNEIVKTVDSNKDKSGKDIARLLARNKVLQNTMGAGIPAHWDDGQT